MTTNEIKELYSSGDYVCYVKAFDSSVISLKVFRPNFKVKASDYKLIHKKHEHIADALIANQDVEVEEWSEMHDIDWDVCPDFFNGYDDRWFDYRLKQDEFTEVPYRKGMDMTNVVGAGIEYRPNRIEVIDEHGRDYSSFLKDAYYEIQIQDDGRTIKLFETKIKKPWYETCKYPCLVTHNGRPEVIDRLCNTTRIQFENDYYRPVTREEAIALVVGE